jgi:hypothetical protein
VDPKIRARFLEDLPRALPLVLAESLRMLRRTRWRRATDETVNAHAQQLVNEAIARTLEDKRAWDPERVPDLHYFLTQVVRSILSSELGSPQSDEIPLENAPNLENDLAAIKFGSASAEEHLFEHEADGGLVDEVLEAAADDLILGKVVNAIIDGSYKSAEIAETTGLDVKVVYQAMRKLRRRIESARKKASHDKG